MHVTWKLPTRGAEGGAAVRFEGLLRPGRVVVVDNLEAHRGERVRQAIEARGASLWFLPACSPDPTPIEEAFAKLKALLRRAAARTGEVLTAAICAALATITPTAARTATAATIAAGAVALFVLVNAKGDADPRAGLESGPTRAPLTVAWRSLRDEIAAWLGWAAGRRS